MRNRSIYSGSVRWICDVNIKAQTEWCTSGGNFCEDVINDGFRITLMKIIRRSFREARFFHAFSFTRIDIAMPNKCTSLGFKHSVLAHDFVKAWNAVSE